ncbi:terminase small subunit [Bacillus gobiensis]|uniref:terminase small subunit n=1 Tax=Bacillus gobiensis TaxID=1441095 RepID=UPI003D1E79E1
MKLTEKQKRFCDYYIETGNATEAARLAGYSQKTAKSIGQENLTKPYLKNYIAKKMAEKDAERIANQDEILAFLTAVMRGELTEQTLRGIGEGAQTIDDIEISGKDRIKAAELLGKRHAIWTDKQKIEGEAQVVIVNDLDD